MKGKFSFFNENFEIVTTDDPETIKKIRDSYAAAILQSMNKNPSMPEEIHAFFQQQLCKIEELKKADEDNNRLTQ